MPDRQGGGEARQTMRFCSSLAAVWSSVPTRGDAAMLRKLCYGTDSDVWFPIYPLCTEHCITESYDMAYECYRQMIALYGGGNVSTCGFSSGAALAMGMARTTAHWAGPSAAEAHHHRRPRRKCRGTTRNAHGCRRSMRVTMPSTMPSWPGRKAHAPRAQ